MIRNRTFRYVALGLIALYVVIPMYATVQFPVWRADITVEALVRRVFTRTVPDWSWLEHRYLRRGVARRDGADAAAPRRHGLVTLLLSPLASRTRDCVVAAAWRPSGRIVAGVARRLQPELAELIIVSPVILALAYVTFSPCRTPTEQSTAGVRSIDLHTLVEAARSMGAGWTKLFTRVLFPNLRYWRSSQRLFLTSWRLLSASTPWVIAA